MRTENSIRNVIWTAIAYFINIVSNFVLRKVFIMFLGTEYNGLNSLFTSIISMLSIAELGIGTAILFELYKPISNGNKNEIKSLMHFYKKCYRVIALIVFIIGIAILPFLNKIVGEITISTNIYAVFVLVLLDTCFSYLLSYKRNILIANQKDDIIKKIHIAYIIGFNFLEILFLYFTKNYYIYLIIKMVMTLIENVIISIFANKLYPFIKEASEPVNKEKESIYKKVKALFFHKVAGFIVNGTDNVLISIFFGVNTVGIYNNYFFVISSVIALVNSLFSSVTPSVGNLLTASKREKNFEIYRKINFINFLITSICSVGLLSVIQPFMRLWLGEEYLMPYSSVVCLVIYFYLRLMKNSIIVFKDAAGIYYEDRFIPILESILNIIFSILFIKLFGLIGVILGTIASTLLLYLYSYPKYVFKPLFGRKIKDYFLEILKYIIFTVVLVVIVISICSVIKVENVLMRIFINGIISIITYIILVLIIYRNKEEFIYTINLIKDILRKRKTN